MRPRYEIEEASGRVRFCHVNVERTDLSPDPNIPRLGDSLGKGYILPLPVLPVAHYRATILPTPMTTAQQELPIAVALYDADGTEVARRFLGRVPRRSSTAVAVDELLAEAGAALPAGYGHAELMYDFREGGEADGWLHALARFEARDGGHITETTFGAHIYNTALVYRDEPQSYNTRPPGLSTRLFLQLGRDGLDALCHLIYPASLPWHPRSQTRITAFAADGREVASHDVAIPCGGSLFWRMGGLFGEDARKAWKAATSSSATPPAACSATTGSRAPTGRFRWTILSDSRGGCFGGRAGTRPHQSVKPFDWEPAGYGPMFTS